MGSCLAMVTVVLPIFPTPETPEDVQEEPLKEDDALVHEGEALGPWNAHANYDAAQNCPSRGLTTWPRRVVEFRGSGVQGFRGSGVQGFRGSGVQGFRGSGVQGFRGSGVQGLGFRV